MYTRRGKYTKSEHFYKVNCRKVMNIETKEIYNSLKEAADNMFCHPHSIGYACKDPVNRTCLGYHWKYCDNN